MSGLWRFSRPHRSLMKNAQGAIASREGVIVRLDDDPIGIGEASPLPRWTESMAACREVLE